MSPRSLKDGFIWKSGVWKRKRCEGYVGEGIQAEEQTIRRKTWREETVPYIQETENTGEGSI